MRTRTACPERTAGRSDATLAALLGLATVAASLLLLSGCATPRADLKTSAVAVPNEWSGARAETKPGGSVGSDLDASLVSWWTRLGDPVLTSLVERSLAASTDVKKATARLREARARRGLAASDLLPEVAASASATRSRTGQASGPVVTGNALGAGLDASWETDLFGGKRRALEASDADLAATAAGLEDVKASLAAEVALAYVDLRLNEARARIAMRNLESQSETLALTRMRKSAGLSDGLEVARAESRVAETKALVPVYVEGRENAANRLCVLLGVAPGALNGALSREGSGLRVPETAAAGIPADALRRRPDVRQAELRLVAETARTAEAKADLFPKLTLGGRLAFESSTLSSLFDARSLVASVVGGLTAPLFDRRKIRLKIEAQDAVAAQALADYEAAILAALEEAENAFAALDGSRARREALDSGVVSARTAADLARKSWTAGLSDLEAVLDSERSLLTIEESLARARADEVSAFVRFSKALGGGPVPNAPGSTDERKNG